MNKFVVTIFVVTLVQFSSCAYNLNESIDSAYYAAITHCPAKQIQAWSCKLCPKVTKLVNVTYLDNTKTHIVGFVGFEPVKKRIIVSYRCTVDVINFFEDLSFQKIPLLQCKGCEIHLGFYEAFKSIEHTLLASVSKIIESEPNAVIYSIGHSLGGALATITALELQLKFGKVVQAHTFGGPRIGNTNLAQYFKLKIPEIYRVIHYRDLAPHLPFEEMDYRHPAQQVLFDEAMQKYELCDDSGEDRHCSNKYFPEYNEKYHHSYFFPFEC